MDSRASLSYYVGATFLALVIVHVLRFVFKLYEIFLKKSHKQIHLTRSQVMEIACNLAKMSSRFPENAQKCIDLVQKYNLDVNFFLPQVGLTIFLSACIGGHANLVRTLLECDADISIRSNGGDPPLYLTTAGYFRWPHRHFVVFRQLLDAGCDVNDANSDGYAPLHLAASHGDIRLIEFLLEAGASPSKETLHHTLPIDMAIEAGKVKAAEILETKHRPCKERFSPQPSMSSGGATVTPPSPGWSCCPACNGTGSQKCGNLK